MFQNDYSRFMRVCFVHNKSDALYAIERFLCDTRSDGEVAIIRSDSGVKRVPRDVPRNS